MARSAVPKLFWARLKSELGEHLANQASHNVLKIMIAWMIFGSKLLSSFLMSAIYSFLKYLRYRQTPTWESAVGGENGHLPSLEIGIASQILLKKQKAAA